MSHLINIQQFRFRWPGQQSWLLDIPELSISPGEKVFIQGQSGSGKSTFLNLVAGTLSPSEGEMHFSQKNWFSLSSQQRDQVRGDEMGFIFQMFNLIPHFTAEQNVLLPCHFSKKKREIAIESAGSLQKECHRLLETLQLDIQDVQKQTVQTMSIGQQQRVAAARALIGRPQLIIADEPTSALDSDARDTFLQLLFKECEKSDMAILFVSHDSQLKSHFDRTIPISQLRPKEGSA